MYMSTQKGSSDIIEKGSKKSLVFGLNPSDSFFKAMTLIS